jgi:Xaa-Pro aminopeptidase
MRLEKLRRSLAEKELDAILISQPENRRYLSGFTGSAGWLVITAQEAILATDFRYYEQAGREAPDFQLAKIKTRFEDLLPELLSDLEIKRLGFESEHASVHQFYSWSEAANSVEWLPQRQTVEQIRAVKDEGEVQALRRSVALTDAAFAHLLDVLEPGMTEEEAAWQIEAYMRTHGASKVAFNLIVAAGPNGAMPHASAGKHRIAEGEAIVIDIGCIVDGYCSDMTRTICLGKPDSRYLEVWQIVRRAQETAEATIRAGMTGVEADASAREVIEKAGYGDNFGHGLGHGVGLAVHEMPWANPRLDNVLEAGMVLTVEPGIYLPGEFGVRIEDLVIIGEEGVEVLTQSPKRAVSV